MYPTFVHGCDIRLVLRSIGGFVFRKQEMYRWTPKSHITDLAQALGCGHQELLLSLKTRLRMTNLLPS